MNPRTRNILEAAIESFIHTGEPVSSGWLYQHYDFGIKPAMIRLELNDLTDSGYLEQPHYSAGRIPRNLGYEFYAEGIMEQEEDGRASAELRAAFCSCSWRQVAEEISRELGVLGVVAGDDMVVKNGLDVLVEHLNWENRRDITGVIQDFEELDKKITAQASTLEEDLRVYVGRKSPVTRSEQLSVVMAEYTVRGQTARIITIGPKRMDYARAIQMLKGLADAEDEG